MDHDTTAPHTTRMPHFTAPHITETPHNITEVPQTEDSLRYTQFLQNYGTQLNNIMNPDTNSSEESVGQADEVVENLIQENPSLHIKINKDEPELEPHYIHALWTQLMKLIGRCLGNKGNRCILVSYRLCICVADNHCL